MGHCRLIYRSACSDAFMPNEDLRRLVRQSADNNRDSGITGLLILSGDHFLQALEGPAQAVNRLFMRIVRDERHHDVELISYEQIGPKYFDNWDMHLVDLFDLSKHPRRYFADKYQVKNGVVQIPDRLHEVYALLLDAKAICTGRPWDEDLGTATRDQHTDDTAPPTSGPATARQESAASAGRHTPSAVGEKS
jgi:hypothetical protein